MLGEKEKDSLLAYLDKVQQPYTLIEKGSTVTIKVGSIENKFLCLPKEDCLPKKCLGQMVKLKTLLTKYYYENQKQIDHRARNIEICYQKFASVKHLKEIYSFDSNENFTDSHTPIENLKPIYQVDITLAYPTCANLQGYISDEMMKTIIEKRKENPEMKRAYHIAIGSLATSIFTSHVTFENGQKKQIYENVEKPETRGLRDIIANEIGVIMQNLFHLDSLFFWVDAVFFRTEKQANEAREYLLSRGYNTTIEKFHCRSFSDKIYLYNENSEPKYFQFPYNY